MTVGIRSGSEGARFLGLRVRF